MPDTHPLNELRRQLSIALESSAAMRGTPWVDPRPMRAALHQVERQFDRVEPLPQQDTLRAAVQGFLKTGRVASFRDLKYTCYGLAVTVDALHARLVDQPEALGRLLAQVDGERSEDRRFARCYQALLRSYFAYAVGADEFATQLQTQASFRQLRGFLSDRLGVVAQPIRGRVAGWVITLQEHRNLLTDHPCDRYTDELAKGKTDQLAEVCQGLGISRNSWVWQEVILAYLSEICQREDAGFKQSLDQALDLSDGHTALPPSPATSRAVVARVVKRYSAATDKPELPRLRDAALHHVGNPWLRRTAWDAWVQHEPARQMVDGWLKSKLMEDFFTLLSEMAGGAVDRRRLTYWLKYIDVIEDMWFMLGSDAYHDRSPEFIQMRARMTGRMKAMTGGPSQNNAFVMHIGGHQFIEFGSTGNACYIYPPDTRLYGEEDATVDLNHTLKRGYDRLTHRGDWESRFDWRMRAIFGRDILGDRARQSGRDGGIQNSPTAQLKPVATVVAPAAQPSPTPAPAPLPATHIRSASALSGTAPPATAAATDLWTFLQSCRDAGIFFRIVDPEIPVVWLSQDAIKVQSIAVELVRLGFDYDHDPSRFGGFWHRGQSKADQNQPLPSKPEVLQPESLDEPVSNAERETDMSIFLAACRAAGLECKIINTAQPLVWLAKEAITIPHIAGELKRRGFRYVDDPLRVGFWYEGKEKPAILPSSRADQPVTHTPTLTDELESIFERCRRVDLPYKDFSDSEVHVWIHEDVRYWLALEQAIRRMGFERTLLGDSAGFWLGTPVPLNGYEAAVEPDTNETGIAETLAACDNEGVKHLDLRDRGGNLWVYTTPGLFPTITGMLELQGFRYSDRKAAYWLPGSE